MTEPRVAEVISHQGNDLADLCNAEADKVGMPPRVMVACAIAESNIDERAERWGVWPDVSFGTWQQTVAYAPIGDQTNSPENIALVRAALFDVATAAAIAAPQLGSYWAIYQDGRETLGRYNWPALGYAGNPNAANIDRAWEASAAYVVAVPPDVGGLVYDADCPITPQQLDWTCSCRTVTWALNSLGFGVDPETIAQQMVDDGLVTSALGLLDGSGEQLQDWLQDTFGVSVERQWYADWYGMDAWLGIGPVLLGGQRWNHWAGVRRGDADGLQLANPAGNWHDVGQHMSLPEWNSWGEWAALWIDPTYGGTEPVTDASRAYVQTVAENEIVKNLEKALTYGLPPEAEEAILHGALPAANTLARGEF